MDASTKSSDFGASAQGAHVELVDLLSESDNDAAEDDDQGEGEGEDAAHGLDGSRVVTTRLNTIPGGTGGIGVSLTANQAKGKGGVSRTVKHARSIATT